MVHLNPAVWAAVGSGSPIHADVERRVVGERRAARRRRSARRAAVRRPPPTRRARPGSSSAGRTGASRTGWPSTSSTNWPLTVWVAGSVMLAASTTRSAVIERTSTWDPPRGGSHGTNASTTNAPPGASTSATAAKHCRWRSASASMNSELKATNTRSNGPGGQVVDHVAEHGGDPPVDVGGPSRSSIAALTSIPGDVVAAGRRAGSPAGRCRRRARGSAPAVRRPARRGTPRWPGRR